MGTSEEKERLRLQLLDKRESIVEEEFQQKSEQIIARLQSVDALRTSRTIHCYISMNTRREVNTHAFLRWMLATNKRVVVPVTQFKTNTLKHVELHSFEELNPNKWGVLEPPPENRTVKPNELDLVIVPMVGADLHCNRIGYGKGFYDRFLADVTGQAVGLCFESCVVDEIPTESFDVELSAVVTEDRIISC